MNWWIIFKANWEWFVAAIGTGALGFLVNPRAWWRKLRNKSETDDLRAGIEKNKTIRAEMHEMHQDIIILQREVREMRSEMHQVKMEKADLHAEVISLRAENFSLKTSNESLRSALDACEQNLRE